MGYDLQTQALMEEVKRMEETFDEGLLPKLEQLEKTATALNDDFLLGFTYYYCAFARYYFDSDRAGFTHYLTLAVHYLIKIEDHEMLVRVFNMVAIEAFNYGSYDVAYSYYINALQEAKAGGYALFVTVIETNLALAYMELGDYLKARDHIKQAIKSMPDYKKDNFRVFPLHAAYVDEAVIELELKDYTAAKKSLKKARDVLPAPGAPDEDLSLSLTMIDLRLAVIEGEEEEKKLYSERLIELLKIETYPEGYVGDIRSLARFLSENGEVKLVGRILDAINERVLKSGRAHTIRMFTTLKVDYAVRSGNKKLLKESLMEQQKYIKKYRSNLNNIQSYTLDMIELNETIRKEQLEARGEKKKLEKKAYSDALTGVSNRRMLNKLMVSAFERAYHSGSLLGIEIMDINYFKEFNDSLGHLEGDKCLIAIAEELAKLCEEDIPEGGNAFCGRYGGDEFILIYEGLTDEDISAIAKRLEERVAKLKIAHPAKDAGGTVSIAQGISIGTPEQKQRIWDYTAAADESMYKAKKKIRNKKKKTGGIHITKIRAIGEKEAGAR